MAYRSKFEGRMADAMKASGIKFKYEPTPLVFYSKVRSGLCENCGTGEHVVKKRRYIPDFKVGKVYIEGKGKFTPSERTKFLDIRAHNPKLDIRLVFMYNNKLSRNHTKRYLDWAEEHGWKACVGPELPPEWVKELAPRVKNTDA